MFCPPQGILGTLPHPQIPPEPPNSPLPSHLHPGSPKRDRECPGTAIAPIFRSWGGGPPNSCVPRGVLGRPPCTPNAPCTPNPPCTPKYSLNPQIPSIYYYGKSRLLLESCSPHFHLMAGSPKFSWPPPPGGGSFGDPPKPPNPPRGVPAVGGGAAAAQGVREAFEAAIPRTEGIAQKTRQETRSSTQAPGSQVGPQNLAPQNPHHPPSTPKFPLGPPSKYQTPQVQSLPRLMKLAGEAPKRGTPKTGVTPALALGNPKMLWAPKMPRGTPNFFGAPPKWSLHPQTAPSSSKN